VRYEIVVHELAAEELAPLRAFDQRRIVAEIRDQLADQPGTPSRRRKCLFDLRPSFEHESPIWELRVGQFRFSTTSRRISDACTFGPSSHHSDHSLFRPSLCVHCAR
jgi:hypothetical protein